MMSNRRRVTFGAATLVTAVVAVTLFIGLRRGPHGVASGGSGSSLVILVPGTWGNTAFWTDLVPGEATFASELQRAAGAGTDVRPFMWASSVEHDDRLAAARNLAKLIDDEADRYGRVSLVAHSHGGNVAFLAAGMAHARVDLIVCLSTPHLHLKCRSAGGGEVRVPVYCTAACQRNVRSIVNIVPDTDAVPEGWANWRTGLTDNQAVDLTTEARAALGEPRLDDDGGVLTDLLGGPRRVSASRELENVASAQQVVIQSYVPDGFGSRAHSVIHSRRMGYVVGQLVGAGADAQAVRYAGSIVQPADADDGGPVPAAQQAQWCAENAPAFGLAGWRLTEVDATLDPQAGQAAGKAADNGAGNVASNMAGKIAGNLAGSLAGHLADDLAGKVTGSDPTSRLKIARRDPEGDAPIFDSPDAPTGYSPRWQTRAVLFANATYRFTVRPASLGSTLLGLVADRDLGSQTVTIPSDGAQPTDTLSSDADHATYWGATLKWEPVHY